MSRHWLGCGLRHPVVHFVLIGATLFAASELWSLSEPARPPVQREPIVISAEQISVMEEDFVRRWGMLNPYSTRSLGCATNQRGACVSW